MKTPIEHEDIKAGDKLRWEGPSRGPGTLTAVEYEAASDEHCQFTDGQHYLLDRPTPPVELPTEPTLGWVKSGEQGYLDTWCREGDGVYDSTGLWAQAKFIDSWTPAVAVPKVALDDLREYIDRITPSSVLTTGDLKVVLDFLAAVDATTRDHTHDTDVRGLG